MNLATPLLTILCLVLIAPANAQTPDGKAILNKALKATAKLKSVRYTTTGIGSDGVPFKATVFQKATKDPEVGSISGNYWVVGEFDRGKSKEAFAYSYDGNDFRYRLDNNRDVQKIEGATMAEVVMVVPLEHTAVAVEFFRLQPRLDGMTDVKFVKRAKYGGRDCDLIEITRELRNPMGGQSRFVNRWGIDRKTGFPVHFEWGKTARKTIQKLELNAPASPAEFKLMGMEMTVEKSDIFAKGLLAVGEPAPDFSVIAADGSTLTPATFNGRVVLIDFWGTWCPPCVKSMPALKSLYERFKDKGLEVVSMAVADEKNDPIGFMKNNGYGWTAVARGETAARAFRVTMFPTVYLLGKDGAILYRVAGKHDATESILSKLIAENL